MTAKCKLGIHKYGNIKEYFVGKNVMLARKCEICGKIKPEKK